MQLFTPSQQSEKIYIIPNRYIYNNRFIDYKHMAETPVTAAELTELIGEFEKYRARLIDETTEAAKKAKLSKKATMAKLEPQLAEIDTKLERLRSQKAQLNGE